MRVAPREHRRLCFLRVETAQIPYKKWKAIFQDENGKEFVRYFGGKLADGKAYDDYTTTGTEEQRRKFLSRHAHFLREPMKEAKDHDDELYLVAPCMLSYHILWGDSRDIKTNIRAFKKTYLGGNFLGESNVGTSPIPCQESSDGAGNGQAP